MSENLATTCSPCSRQPGGEPRRDPQAIECQHDRLAGGADGSWLTSTPPPQPLSIGHFRRIAAHGFGDGCNSYAWSMVWYNGRAFVGTGRHLLAEIKRRLQCTGETVWPVPARQPGTEYNSCGDYLDIRGQIWRYDPATESWDRVYRSPRTKNAKGETVAVAYGFRNMSVFQSKSDSRPAIYTIPSCGWNGVGPVMLRSDDGEHFDQVTEPGLGLGNDNLVAFRGNVPFKGRLFISPSGSRSGKANVSHAAVVLCSDDPVHGRWEASNIPSFGDPTNQGIFDLGTCGDYLYAGTINIRQGCQVWRTRAEGPPPHDWEKVFDHGAGRGQHNQGVMMFCEFHDDLYIGTGIQNGGRDQDNNIGPHAGEVIRVRPDGTWDLVVGEPRMTKQGFKAPHSGLGPGFDNPFAGYIWRGAVHEGTLYIGTFDSSSLLPFMDRSIWPPWVRNSLNHEVLERFLELRGGCNLWRTTDGDRWVPVTRNGFGNPYNWGVRTLLSSPIGLFVGTANPFGPKVAISGPGGWRFEENPQGGCEVWLGTHHHRVSGSREGAAIVHSVPWLNEGGGIPLDFLESLAGCGETPPEGSDRGRVLDTLTDLVELSAPDEWAVEHHDLGDATRVDEQSWRLDPSRLLTTIPEDLVGLTESVDEEVARYFAGSDLRNVGYWRHQATPRQACEQLVDELLAMVPPSLAADGRPAFLVAGHGDLAARVRRRWVGAAVVSLSAQGKDAAAWRRLTGSLFDVVLWVEGPSACGDRLRGLREARRVLRRGGCLIAADLAGHPKADLAHYSPRLDDEPASKVFNRQLRQVGFTQPWVVDATAQTWSPFFKHSQEHFTCKALLHQIDREQEDRIFAALPGGDLVVEAYLIVSAVKV
jgi:hypothetical protein